MFRSSWKLLVCFLFLPVSLNGQLAKPSTSTHSLALSGKQAESQDAKAHASLAFVTEYVRELFAIETIRDASERNPPQDSASEELSNAIYTSTRMQSELRAQINILGDMRLFHPFETLIPSLQKFYEHKINLFQRLIDISTAFIAGPKPGVDYGKLAAEVPRLRAELDDTDNALFEASPLIFETLIDSKADSQNHLSHLLITRAERAQLIDEINTDFGSKLDEKNRSFQVGAAMVLRAGPLKDFKSSVDPWD